MSQIELGHLFLCPNYTYLKDKTIYYINRPWLLKKAAVSGPFATVFIQGSRYNFIMRIAKG